MDSQAAESSHFPNKTPNLLWIGPSQSCWLSALDSCLQWQEIRPDPSPTPPCGWEQVLICWGSWSNTNSLITWSLRPVQHRCTRTGGVLPSLQPPIPLNNPPSLWPPPSLQVNADVSSGYQGNKLSNNCLIPGSCLWYNWSRDPDITWRSLTALAHMISINSSLNYTCGPLLSCGRSTGGLSSSLIFSSAGHEEPGPSNKPEHARPCQDYVSAIKAPHSCS